jgi:uncharacterized protein YrrD
MSMHTMKAMEGQSVVAVDTAEKIGKVKHFVVSSDASRIERLHIDGRTSNSLFAEWSDLESFGKDRVMVRVAIAPAESDDERDIDAARGRIDLLSSRLLDSAGFEHGTATDASFDADDGRIVSVTSSDGEVIDASRLRSIGSYAIVFDA